VANVLLQNLEGEMLPSTRAALLPHINRANYITMRDKSYTTNHPVLPPIERNGWNVEEGAYVPVRCLTLPAPRAVIELTKCSLNPGAKESVAVQRMVFLALVYVNAMSVSVSLGRSLWLDHLHSVSCRHAPRFFADANFPPQSAPVKLWSLKP